MENEKLELVLQNIQNLSAKIDKLYDLLLQKQGPSQEWLRKMSKLEDSCDSFSVGGMASDHNMIANDHAVDWATSQQLIKEIQIESFGGQSTDFWNFDSSKKYKLLRKFDTPTNLYLVGSAITYESSDVKITDDYTNFGVRVGDLYRSGYGSDGHVSIMTDSEFECWKEEQSDFEDIDYCRIRNFFGEIGLVGVSIDDIDRSYSVHVDFDLDDYIAPKIPQDLEVFLVFPPGTKMIWNSKD
jgi:hypothetical protein